MLFGEFPSDRITVDPDESVLEDLARITGEKKKSPAVARAVTEFIGRKKAREFGALLREGAFDYPDTNDEIGNFGHWIAWCSWIRPAGSRRPAAGET